MSETKHTPGPWRLGDGAAVSELTIVSDAVGAGYFGAIGGATQRDPHPVHGGGISQETAEANARLMIAAPELLAEARVLRCLATSPRFQAMTVSEAFEELAENGAGHDNGAAIAKAEGRP